MKDGQDQSGVVKTGGIPPQARVAKAPAGASDLESVLKRQLDSISASLEAPMTSSQPAQSQVAVSKFAPRPPSSPSLPVATGLDFPSAPKAPAQSEFAPDPVRQRTYVDLRTRPEPMEAGKPAVQRAEDQWPQADDDPDGPRWPPADEFSWDDDAETFDPPPPVHGELAQIEEGGARGRGLDARTLSFAALIGVGVGFVGLTLMSQFTSPSVTSPVVTASVFPVDRIVTNSGGATAAPAGEGDVLRGAVPTKQQERLLTDTPVAVVNDEGRTEAVAIAAPSDVAPTPVEAEKPSVVAKPAEAKPQRAKVATAGRGPVPWTNDDPEPQARALAYAPLPKRNDPQSDPTESSPAENRGPGTAKVSLAVNVRSSPDNDASVVTVAAPGTTVKIEKCVFWCEVVVDGKRGYIYRKFVGR